MKKTLIALAALAATGASFAQSSVSIYGRMDLGYSNSTTKNGFANTETKSSSLGAQNSRTTSRLGFTGTEDLGGGLRARFNYEIALAPDNVGAKVGTSDVALTESQRVGFGGTRLANLSLSGGFGTVTLGTFLNAQDALRGYSAATFNMPGGDFLPRHTTSFTDVGTAGATFAANYWDSTTTGIFAGVNGIGISGRSANSVAYTSPTISGFTFGVGVINDSTKRTPTEAADTRKVSGTTLSARYAGGPINAIALVSNAKNTDLDANTNAKVNNWGFAASYNLGMAVPYIQYETVETKFSAFAGTEAEVSATEIGARFPMGAFTPYVSFGTGKLSFTGEDDAKTRAFQLGTTYDLSKRTSVYAAYGQDRYKFDGDTIKRTGLSLGVVHQF